MGLIDEANELGKKVQQNRKAKQLAEDAAKKAQAEALKKQQEHEQNMRNGMISS